VADVSPSRTLYIGDSYECDVLGANKAGMVSALLLRKDFNRKEIASEEDVYSAQELEEQHRGEFPEAMVVLPSLRVADLERALGNYFGGGSP
jgi:FMN phosphatase YigB (HAD superfamily)